VVYRITWETRTLNPFGEPLKGFAGGAGNWSHKLVSAAPAGGLLFPFHLAEGRHGFFQGVRVSGTLAAKRKAKALLSGVSLAANPNAERIRFTGHWLQDLRTEDSVTTDF
jgi:hypothetical protein